MSRDTANIPRPYDEGQRERLRNIPHAVNYLIETADSREGFVLALRDCLAALGTSTNTTECIVHSKTEIRPPAMEEIEGLALGGFEDRVFTRAEAEEIRGYVCGIEGALLDRSPTPTMSIAVPELMLIDAAVSLDSYEQSYGKGHGEDDAFEIAKLLGYDGNMGEHIEWLMARRAAIDAAMKAGE